MGRLSAFARATKSANVAVRTAPLYPAPVSRGLSLPAALALVIAASSSCGDPQVIGEGQFSRPIPIASAPENPLPRLAWLDGDACPGPEGGCTSFCAGPPASCPAGSCMPLLIDSGTPLTILPDSGTDWSTGRECIEVRAAGGLLDAPDDPTTLAGSSARFRLREAPVVRAPRDMAADWPWTAGDDRNPITVGGVIGGNVLRDFAIELRHLEGETASVAFFSSYPGSERVLADQGRAYLRLQYPGRLLGRLLNDRCEIGPGVDCQLDGFDLDPDTQELIYESSRALVDACVAPPPCSLVYDDGGTCQLSRGGVGNEGCAGETGSSATLLVATGVPGLVLFDDSLPLLVGPLASLPSCAAITAESTDLACREGVTGELRLPGWPPLTGLERIRVRSLGLVQGLLQASGDAPCERLRERLRGLRHQCRGFVAEGRPVRPDPGTGESVASSALVVGEVAWDDDQTGPDPTRWIETLVAPATAAPVIALRREVTPEGAQPDGMVGTVLLRQTETVLDFTEALEKPGVRVRCLDPDLDCMALPACSADEGQVEFENASGGRTSCCFGLPTDLIAEVVLSGQGKEAPRVEDACCAALPRAALEDLAQLDLCEDIDLP